MWNTAIFPLVVRFQQSEKLTKQLSENYACEFFDLILLFCRAGCFVSWLCTSTLCHRFANNEQNVCLHQIDRVDLILSIDIIWAVGHFLHSIQLIKRIIYLLNQYGLMVSFKTISNLPCIDRCVDHWTLCGRKMNRTRTWCTHKHTRQIDLVLIVAISLHLIWNLPIKIAHFQLVLLIYIHFLTRFIYSQLLT